MNKITSEAVCPLVSFAMLNPPLWDGKIVHTAYDPKDEIVYITTTEKGIKGTLKCSALSDPNFSLSDYATQVVSAIGTAAASGASAQRGASSLENKTQSFD